MKEFNKAYLKGYEKGKQGFPFLWLLGLLFIGLKLGKVITWSWWLVCLPFYGGIVAGIALVLIFLVFAIIIASIGAMIN